MKRHKNLERAIVLGLMLSTSISCSVGFAEEKNTSEDYSIPGNQNNTSLNVNWDKGNVIVEGYLGYNNDKEPGNIIVEGSEYGLKINSESGNGIFSSKGTLLIL